MRTTPAAPEVKPFPDVHLWSFRNDAGDWICLLCGGVSKRTPRANSNDLADYYEPLTETERELARSRRGKKLRGGILVDG